MRSIRTRIALLVVLVVGTSVGLFTFATHREVRRAALELAAERISAATGPLAASIASSGEQFLEGVRGTAGSAEVPGYLSDPGPVREAALREALSLAEQLGTPAFELRDPSGARLLVTDTLVPPPGSSLGVPPSDPALGWIGPLSPDPGRPREDGGATVYYPTSASVGPSASPLGTVTAWRILNTPEQERRTIEELVDPMARVYLVDLSEGVWTDFAREIEPFALEDSANEGRSIHSISGANPGGLVLSLLAVDPTPWMVGVSVPRENALQGSDEVLGWLLGLGVLLLAASAIVGWFLAGRVTQGLATLASTADALSRGRYEARAPVRGHDEVGILASAFNTMAERVSESKATLERKLAELSDREAEAREFRERLEHLVGSSRAILFTYELPTYAHPIPGGPGDADPGPGSTPSFHWISDNLRWILAQEPGEALSPGWWEARVHPNDLEETLAIAARLTREEAVVMEYRFLHGDGSYRWIRDERRVRSDGRESASRARSVEVVGVLTDFTQSRDLELSRAAAEGASRAKTEFLSRVSHELRTPLTAVLGFGELLREETAEPASRENAEQVLRAGGHLLALIDEILDITGIEAGRIRLTPVAVDAEEVMREAADLVRFTAEDRGVSLRVRPLAGLDRPVVEVDRQRLRQVLVNLLTNGIKYNRPAGRVEIAIEARGSHPELGRWVRFVVQDTGPGMPESMKPRLFIPFDRLGMDDREPEGIGLGLPLTKALVGAMGGRIEVESEMGVGTRFIVLLPGTESTPNAPRRMPVDAGAPSTPVPDSGPARPGGPETQGRVLLVEDHPANRELIERILRLRPGVSLVTAERGEEGVRKAESHRPDLVLLDLNLPDIGGDRVLEEIRANPALAHTRVAMISGDASSAQAERLLALGAHAYLFKPFAVKELLELVDRLLSPSD